MDIKNHSNSGGFPSHSENSQLSTRSLTSGITPSNTMPQIRVSDLNGISHFSSMDDLVSESGLDDDNIYSHLKMKYYNKALVSYLSQQGLNMNPLKLTPRHLKEKHLLHHSTTSSGNNSPINSSASSNSNVETFITGNGQLLFLPFNPQRKKRRRRHNNIHDEYNDEENDNDIENDNDNDNDNDNELDSEQINQEPDADYDPIDLSSIPNLNALKNNVKNANPENGLHNITYHVFGIIVKIKKSCSLNEVINVNYHTHASVKWTAPEYSKRISFDERYRTSENIDWSLNLSNPDCYIPLKNYKDMSSDYNDLADDFNNYDNSVESDSFSTDSPKLKVNDVSYSNEPTQPIKRYIPLNQNDYVKESTLLNNESMVETNSFKCLTSSNSKIFESGYYIFMLPVVYPLNTIESILIPNGQHSHELSIQIQKGQVHMPTLQAPQSAFLSTSPTHHYKYDDQNFEFQNQVLSSSIASSNNTSANSKNSFLKKIGIRRNSGSNPSKLESTLKISPVSPKNYDQSKSLVSTLLPYHGNTVYNYNYQLHAIRLPPSDATSTLNKSIYVNKVWNKALNYELLLPRKFTQLSPPKSLDISPNNPFLHNNTFMLQMKLVPLVKNLQLKRIKINIVEKITYISQQTNDSTIDNKNSRSRTKERTVTMMEIKTKDKPPNTNTNSPLYPLKTQIIKGCNNDNLLTFCYDNETSSIFKSADIPNKSHNRTRSRSDSLKSAFHNGPKKISRFLDHSSNNIVPPNKDDVVITNPVKLQCPLNFVANDDSKLIANIYENLCTGTSDINDLHDVEFLNSTKNNNDTMSIFSVGSNGASLYDKNDVPVDDDMSFSRASTRRPREFSFSSQNNSNQNISNYHHNNWSSVNNDDKNNSHTFLTDVSFSNLKVRHRLQISFRISRPDPKIKNPDGEFKLHHYEVIVDTPIVFVSPFCITETLDLPSYDDAVKSSMFEVVKNSSKFAMARTTSGESDSFNANDLTNEENSAIFAPCSPLMSSTVPSISNYQNMVNFQTLNSNNNYDPNMITNPLSTSLSSPPLSPQSLSNIENNFNRQRSDSGYTLNSFNPSSLLSAAFSRSKDLSPSLNSVLANNDISALCLNHSRSNINTIDNVINSNDISAPPVYTEIGFKAPNLTYSSTNELAMRSSVNTSTNNTELSIKRENEHPPTYETALKQFEKEEQSEKEEHAEKEEQSEKMNKLDNIQTNSTNLLERSQSRETIQTFQSESVGLLNNRNEYSSTIDFDNQHSCSRQTTSNISNRSDGSIESDLNLKIDNNIDLDSIVNMNIGQMATLNLTPTQNQL